MPKKTKANQLQKSISRIEKITVFNALCKRVKNWMKNEAGDADPVNFQLKQLYEQASSIELLREKTLLSIKALVANGYVPSKKVTSGELKFEFGRQVWIKPKHIETYKEGGWDEKIFNNLFVHKVVKGRVFLSVGKPDPNGLSAAFPPVSVPKMHVTGTAQE